MVQVEAGKVLVLKVPALTVDTKATPEEHEFLDHPAVARHRGGHGAVREAIEHLLQEQGRLAEAQSCFAA